MSLPEELHAQARALVASRLGLDFSERRRADLERGLVHAAGTSSEPALRAYLTRLVDLPESSPDLMHLAQGLTVGETYFFRDRRCFEVLEQEILPALIAARRQDGVRRLRIWSAACATGEEPYSVAILLDRLLPDRAEWAITILATDVNPRSLHVAERALYRDWSFREAPQWLADQYFHPGPTGMLELDSRIRGMVTFAPLNLAANGYPSALTNTTAMDLILCRNVLMYFTEEARRAAAARLQQALVASGWLALSAVEATAELFSLLVPVAFTGTAFFRKSLQSPSEKPSVDEGRAAFGSAAGVRSAALSEGATLPPLARAVPVPSDPPSQPVPWIPPALDSPEDPTEEVAGSAAETDALAAAARLADEGSLDQARRLCEAARTTDPLNPAAHLLLAMICQEQGDAPAAIHALRRTIYLDQDSAPAHFLLGSLLIQQEDRKRGLRCMETVVTLCGAQPRDVVLSGSHGVTAGRLRETAWAYLEAGRA